LFTSCLTTPIETALRWAYGTGKKHLLVRLSPHQVEQLLVTSRLPLAISKLVCSIAFSPPLAAPDILVAEFDCGGEGATSLSASPKGRGEI
jgi:hypothetical protein